MIEIVRYADIKDGKIFHRSAEADSCVTATVSAIIDDVRRRGDDAVKEYTLKFDKALPQNFEVSKQEKEEAYKLCSPRMVEILKKAHANIALFHKRQLNGGFEIKKEDGVVVGQKVTPLAKVGIYVPGGTASYPSTVLMNATPAKIAGVKEIIMVTPPSAEGKIRPEILVAADIAGVDRIFKMGGAQAIAALAFGTQTVPAVDKITGPGNVFVATAKRLVFGQVDIDMIAGPSEVLVIADSGANPVYVAADMLSQAEHDKLASAVLVTDDAALAEKVRDELEVQIPALDRSEIARSSIDNYGKIIIADDIYQAAQIADSIAPEHLEVCTSDPMSMLPMLHNAGSIFLGHNTPEPIGDYFAGPNHTLPTSGTARFSSPLSAEDFVKRSSYIYYTEEALKNVCDDVMTFAMSEGLQAHANSIAVRTGR